MAEYIEREALREVIVNLQFSKHLNKAASLNLMHRAVDNLPAADVVPVARCRECKHHYWEQEPCHGKSVHYCNLPHMRDVEVFKEFFCYYGERKEGEQE